MLPALVIHVYTCMCAYNFALANSGMVLLGLESVAGVPS